MDISNFIKHHWELISGIAIPLLLSGAYAMLRCFTTQPKILIDIHFTVSFAPNRAVWFVQIMNEERTGWQRLILGSRKSLQDCWIEAAFIVDDEIPTIHNRAAFTVWERERGITITEKPYEIELISKLQGEEGFHIRFPNPDTLVTSKEVLAVIEIKRGRERIVTRAVWAVFVMGKNASELHLERLE